MATCRPSSDESEDSQVAFDDVIADYSQDRCLPDTQPIEIETPHVMEATDPTPVAWGFLTRLTPNFYSNIALIKDQFMFGRQCASNQANIQVYEVGLNEMRQEYVNNISRTHYVIRRDEDGDICITDFSSNGTFVNGEIVGKGLSRPLVSKDRITFSIPVGGFEFTAAHESEEAKEIQSFLPEAVTSKYIIRKFIGAGASCRVFLVNKKAPNYPKFAMKVIRKIPEMGALSEESEEVKILKRLNHPNIIQVEGFYATNDLYIIIMEAALGGELFDFVLHDYEHKTFDENVAKFQFFQIIDAVNHMHSLGICHRDLKLENILMKTKSRTAEIKIADFGLSKTVGFNTKLKTYVGTPHYIAPEVLRNGVLSTEDAYTLSADMWSLGCILYSLLCGSPAFTGKTDEELKLNILCKNYTLDHPALKNVSFEALDLVKKLLRLDPMKRLSASGVLEHPWLKRVPDYRQISRGLRNLSLKSNLPPTDSKKRRAEDEDLDKNLPQAKRW